MKRLILLSLAILLLALVPKVSANLEQIYLSALPGPPDGGTGSFSYISLNDEFYPGTTFQIDHYAAIGIVGGTFKSNSGTNTIFGLVGPKPSDGMVPDLDSILPHQRTLIEVPSSPPGSHDRWGHLYQVLAPGNYTVLFGTGRYGATGQAGVYAENIDLDPALPFTYIPASGLIIYQVADVRLFVEGSFLADPGPCVKLLGPEAFSPSAELIDFETGTTGMPDIPGVQFLDHGPRDGMWFGGSAAFIADFFDNQALVNNISTTYGNLGIAFDQPVLRIGAYIGVVDGYTHEWSEQITLAAYNATGNLIYQSVVNVPTVGERPLFIGMESNAGIARVEWLGGDSGFFGIDNIIYETPEQTLEAAPTLDAEVDFSNGGSILDDNDTTILVQNVAFADIDRRGILEFDISAIPNDTTITSATLELDIIFKSGSGDIQPTLYLHGYEGNGTLEIADGQVPSNLIGQSDPILSPAVITIDLDVDYIGSLLSITDYLGLLLLGDENGRQAGFVTIEGEIPDVRFASKLTIQYLVEPITMAGDFNCDLNVDMNDLAALCEHWLLRKLLADVVPDGGDGIVNLLDFADFSSTWQGTSEDMAELAVFSEQWLQVGATSAEVVPFDIAPVPDGDGIINFLDFAVFANQWLWEE